MICSSVARFVKRQDKNENCRITLERDAFMQYHVISGSSRRGCGDLVFNCGFFFFDLVLKETGCDGSVLGKHAGIVL